MFERYTEQARRVIFFARYEASLAHSHEIQLEHLALALLREDPKVQSLFGDPAAAEAFRKEVEANYPSAPPKSTTADLPLSQACKRALSYGAECADRSNHRFIGCLHLFAGLLQETNAPVVKLLCRHGIEMDQLTAELTRLPAHPTVHQEQEQQILAILRGGESRAAKLLLDHGISLDVAAGAFSDRPGPAM